MEHDNFNGPCCCGAWHDKVEMDLDSRLPIGIYVMAMRDFIWHGTADEKNQARKCWDRDRKHYLELLMKTKSQKTFIKNVDTREMLRTWIDIADRSFPPCHE